MFQRAREFMRDLFLHIYRPDGTEFIRRKMEDNENDEEWLIVLDDKDIYYKNRSLPDSENEQIFDNLLKYSTHPLTILSYFLGLPNHPPFDKKHEEQSWTHLFNNFIGWQPYATLRRKLSNILFMPILIPWNLISMPFKAGLNIAKIFTELLPLSLSSLAMKGVTTLNHIMITQIKHKKVFPFLLTFWVGILPLLAFGAFTRLLYLLGRATTSPIKNMMEGRLWVRRKFSKDGMDTTLGKTIGWIPATFLLFVTVSIYAILFPIAAYLLASLVLPYSAAHLPAGILALSPTLIAIGNAMAPVAAWALTIFSFGILNPALLQSVAALSLAASGFGVLAALGMGAIEVLVSPYIRQLNNKWHTQEQHLPKAKDNERREYQYKSTGDYNTINEATAKKVELNQDDTTYNPPENLVPKTPELSSGQGPVDFSNSRSGRRFSWSDILGKPSPNPATITTINSDYQSAAQP